MNLEEKNKEKRKHESLTNKEWLTFFFFPFNQKSSLLHSNEFSKAEDDRFEKFEFDKKIEQLCIARRYGHIFYILIFFIIVLILKN